MRQIAFLMRDAGQFHESLPLIDDLHRSGMAVQVFSVGPMIPADIQQNSERETLLTRLNINFYSTSSGGLEALDFRS